MLLPVKSEKHLGAGEGGKNEDDEYLLVLLSPLPRLLGIFKGHFRSLQHCFGFGLLSYHLFPLLENFVAPILLLFLLWHRGMMAHNKQEANPGIVRLYLGD